MTVTGRVARIQRFCVHDGPGIRTTVFFTGCPLGCCWCHNPECLPEQGALLVHTEHAWKVVKAFGGGEAVLRYLESGSGQGCEERNMEQEQLERLLTTGDIELTGREMRIDEIMDEIERDSEFFRESGGGVTLSGGEPLLQPDFAHALLQHCRGCGLHTAVDTCAYVSWECFARVLPLVDLFLVDLKHMDPDMHKRYTGMDNALILKNLRALAAGDANIVVTIPVIPGCNDDGENLRACGRFLERLGGVRVRLLPYHRFARSKWCALGKRYGMPDIPDDTACYAVKCARGILSEYCLRMEAEA